MFIIFPDNMSNVLSITIRRESGLSKEAEDSIMGWLRKTGDAWIAGIEKEDTERHMHIHLTTDKRPNNVTRALKTLLKVPPRTDEWKYAVICKIHNNPKYLVGYVTKDGKYISSQQWCEENILILRLEYEKSVLKTGNNKSIHAGNFDIECENFCRANSIDMKQVSLDTILGQMYLTGDYRMNQFLLRHAKVSVKMIWDTRIHKDAYRMNLETE